VTEPVRLGADLADVTHYLRDHPMARAMLATLDDETTALALGALQDALRPYQSLDGILLGSAAWLVTARK
jgi:hypothetical protein